ISAAWTDKRDQVDQNVGALVEALQAREKSSPGGKVERQILDRIAGHFAGMFDPVHGGLKGSPKFPQSSILELLWRAYIRSGRSPEAAHLREAVVVKLDRMCQGGIYVHPG